ncbi:integrase [Mameliella alba]|uniref:tyrosine-type recombinase/integrase n=1 Tax=Mameliella alba TaxID=561184 RepID=UPI000B534AFA|nr:site-specific integrase [Mameliella alba]OWV64443.1 integrase [Mameliella alba]
MRAKITLPFLRNLKPGDREFFVWDESMAGFGVRVKPNGTVSFLVQHKIADGRTRRQTLGTFGKPGHPTLQQARQAAQKILAEVQLGADPIGDARAKRDALTVSDLCSEYLAEADAGRILNRSGRPKASSTLEIDRGRIRQHILPLLGRKRLEDLTRQDVSQFIRSVEMGKTARNEASGNLRGRTVVTGGAGTARRTTGLLSGILAFAVERGYIASNPAHGVKRSADRKRTIGDAEIIYAALGRALKLAEDRGEDWRALAVVRLIALTGMRRGEAVGLRWDEVRRNQSTVEMVATKTGRSVRPLARAAIELLDGLPGAWGQGFAFPAPRAESGAYGSIQNAWRRITTAPDMAEQDREALSNVTLHHLRHAAATTGHEIKLSLPTIAGILGHSVGGMTSGYIHIDHALRTAADRLGDRIAAMLDGERQHGAEVIHLPQKQ